MEEEKEALKQRVAELEEQVAALTLKLEEKEELSRQKAHQKKRRTEEKTSTPSPSNEEEEKAKELCKLNVGGQKFTTLRSTLLRHQDTFLAALASDRHTVQTDAKGYYFIDRNPRHFATLLDHLRDPSSPVRLPQEEKDRVELISDLDYYGFLWKCFPEERTEELKQWVNDFFEACGPHKFHLKAAELWAKALEGDQGDALFRLALQYDLGDDEVQHDYKEAVRLYHEAAEKGHSEALYNLGICYQEGDGVEEDQVRAVRFFTQAAERGHKQAQYYLALAYKEGGMDLEPNKNEAIRWFRKAAAQGHTVAQSFLADDQWQINENRLCFS
ncbi:BTB (POZ) domain-containing protein [Balamuthia mandrillaris]